jgi:hypothetical protein
VLALYNICLLLMHCFPPAVVIAQPQVCPIMARTNLVLIAAGLLLVLVGSAAAAGNADKGNDDGARGGPGCGNGCNW